MRRVYKFRKLIFLLIIVFCLLQSIDSIVSANESNVNLGIAEESKVNIGIAEEKNDEVTKEEEETKESITEEEKSAEEKTTISPQTKTIKEIMDFLEDDKSEEEKTTTATDNEDTKPPIPKDPPSENNTNSSNTTIDETASDDSVDDTQDTDENQESETESVSNTVDDIAKYNSVTVSVSTPQLDIETSTNVLPGEELIVTVTSDSKPLEGVTVKFINELITDESGTISITIPKTLHNMKLILSATKEEYSSCSKLITIGSLDQTDQPTPTNIQPSSRTSMLEKLQELLDSPFLDRLIKFKQNM